MAAGYLLDAVRLPMPPALLLVLFVGAALAALIVFRELSPAPAGSTGLAVTVTLAAFGYFLWLASPSLLPVTDGPDVVHHLQLIHFVQRTHRLPMIPRSCRTCSR